MSKKQIHQTQTELSAQNGEAKQVSATFTVDDNCLPSPLELEAYQKIDPAIVSHLLESARKEQMHRHSMDEGKLKIVIRESKREGRINWWGMFFAFLVVLSMGVLTAYALYLDKSWFASFMGLGAITSLVSIFVGRGNVKK